MEKIISTTEKLVVHPYVPDTAKPLASNLIPKGRGLVGQRTAGAYSWLAKKDVLPRYVLRVAKSRYIGKVRPEQADQAFDDYTNKEPGPALKPIAALNNYVVLAADDPLLPVVLIDRHCFNLFANTLQATVYYTEKPTAPVIAAREGEPIGIILPGIPRDFQEALVSDLEIKEEEAFSA